MIDVWKVNYLDWIGSS